MFLSVSHAIVITLACPSFVFGCRSRPDVEDCAVGEPCSIPSSSMSLCRTAAAQSRARVEIVAGASRKKKSIFRVSWYCEGVFWLLRGGEPDSKLSENALSAGSFVMLAVSSGSAVGNGQ